MQSIAERVSVLIVSWNEAALLSRCVQSILRAMPTPPQIVIVDNGSTPPLQPLVGTHWIRSEENLGFAGGNNLGLSACTGDYLLLLNNDTCLPDKEPIESLVNFLDTHPTVAAVQAKMQRPDGTLDTCGEFLTAWGVLYHHGYCQPDGAHAQHPFPIYAAKAACCLIRKSALAAVGNTLFQNNYFCYGEDIELCHRFWKADLEVWFVPTHPILHLERATSSKLPSRKIWRHYLSNLLSTACHHWDFLLWLRLGPGLLGMLVISALLKGVLPKSHPHSITTKSLRSSKDFLTHTYVRVPLRYLFCCLTRNFKHCCYPLPSSTSTCESLTTRIP